MTEEELIELLKKNLRVETDYASNDPDDDGRVVRLLYGDIELSEDTL